MDIAHMGSQAPHGLSNYVVDKDVWLDMSLGAGLRLIDHNCRINQSINVDDVLNINYHCMLFHGW